MSEAPPDPARASWWARLTPAEREAWRKQQRRGLAGSEGGRAAMAEGGRRAMRKRLAMRTGRVNGGDAGDAR